MSPFAFGANYCWRNPITGIVNVFHFIQLLEFLKFTGKILSKLCGTRLVFQLIVFQLSYTRKYIFKASAHSFKRLLHGF